MNKINLGILGKRSVDFRMNFWCQNISESHCCFLRSKIFFHLVHSSCFDRDNYIHDIYKLTRRGLKLDGAIGQGEICNSLKILPDPYWKR